MTNEEIVQQLQRARSAGNKDAIEKYSALLVVQNKGLIMKATEGYKQYAKCEADMEDYDSVAKEAFIAAAYTYDSSKEATFATWATYNGIEFALREYVRKNKLIRISYKLQRLIKIFDDIVEKYKSSHDGLNPPDKIILVEMNKKIKVTQKKLEDIKAGKAALELVSIDAQINEQGITGESIIDRVDFLIEPKTPEEIYLESEENQRKSEEYATVRKMLKKLSEEEQDIIRMVFFEGLKQTEVAKKLGKNKQYVNKKLKRVYSKMFKMKEMQNIAFDRGWRPEN